jgi:tRNA threonylcarbamoyl adenosine modification protein YeaZ
VNVLIVDTTGERLLMALAAGGSISVGRASSKRPHDERIIPELDRLLAKKGLSIGDIGAVAVVRGPGRFTGIRIGMTFAGVLGSCLGKPVAAVSLLEAAAEGKALAKGEIACAAVPGFRGEWFLQLFRKGPAPASKPFWGEPKAASEWLARAAGKHEVRLCGPGSREALGLLPGSARVRELPGGGGPVRARDILAAALRKLSSGRREAAAPLYLKPAHYERTAR